MESAQQTLHLTFRGPSFRQRQASVSDNLDQDAVTLKTVRKETQRLRMYAH